MSPDILDTIDRTVADVAVSRDAMRWVPDAVEDAGEGCRNTTDEPCVCGRPGPDGRTPAGRKRREP